MADKKKRFCPAHFFELLSFGVQCLERCQVLTGAVEVLEFGPRGVTARGFDQVIQDYFSYKTNGPEQGERLKNAFRVNGDRRFRLTVNQISNNIWNVK